MLQEPAFLILTALADEPRHGYAIIAAVHELSGGRLTLRAGTLYAALDRFLEAGFVRVESEEVVEGRARRIYAITEVGIITLTKEVERLEGNAAAGRRFLRGRGTGRHSEPGLAKRQRSLQAVKMLLHPRATNVAFKAITSVIASTQGKPSKPSKPSTPERLGLASKLITAGTLDTPSANTRTGRLSAAFTTLTTEPQR
jgi:PadR family transcriptional regulator, regulatory protein PadR